jgi:hypothetical protein
MDLDPDVFFHDHATPNFHARYGERRPVIPFGSYMASQVPVLPSHRMGKFKPVRGGKKKGSTAPPGGVACVVLLLAGMVLVMLFMYWVLKSANG